MSLLPRILVPALGARALAACALVLSACGGGSGADSDAGGSPGTRASVVDAVDGPIVGLDATWVSEFNDGDFAFSTPLREADGLGPLYTRSSCAACHDSGSRGPGLVQKMAVVDADGVTPSADQSALPFGHTVHPLTAGGGQTPIVPPADDPSIKVTQRLGPPVIGRGYMEAIADSEIERVAREQSERDDGIQGRVNYVRYASEGSADARFHDTAQGERVIGRFGLKARIAMLDDFTADALQGDMGITSPLRPEEFANPDGLSDDYKPGIDVAVESVKRRAIYVRLLAIPMRQTTSEGEALFARAKCNVCHVPSLRTRADYPVADLADIDAPVFTDLLLHRMGNELADGIPADASTDGEAGSVDWRTAPLIGLRFNRTYLHDGRAHDIAEAIEMHRGDGSEANVAVDAFDALSGDERARLIEYVGAL